MVRSQGLFIAMLTELDPPLSTSSIPLPSDAFSTQIFGPDDFFAAHLKSCHAYQQSMFEATNSDLPIVIDTGASTSITPVLSDFVGDLKPASIHEVNQLSGRTKVVGKCLVE